MQFLAAITLVPYAYSWKSHVAVLTVAIVSYTHSWALTIALFRLTAKTEVIRETKFVMCINLKNVFNVEFTTYSRTLYYLILLDIATLQVIQFYYRVEYCEIGSDSYMQ